MKKKILGIFVMTLLIVGIFSSFSYGRYNTDKLEENRFENNIYHLQYLDEKSGKFDIICDANGPYYGIVGEPVQFHGSASGGEPPYFWYWEFGDGESSEEQNPIHIYESPDIYPVILHVSDYLENHCSDETIANIEEGTEDNEPPEVTITYPEDGDTIPYEIITLTGYVSDNVGVTHIGGEHRWEGGSSTASYTPPEPCTYCNFDWPDITLREGWNEFTIYAYDAAENYGSQTIEVDYEPTLAIFNQIDWHYNGEPILENSLWGRMDIDANPDPSSFQYMNVVADAGYGPAWIIQNYPIFPLQYGIPNEQAINFNINELGIEEGISLTNIDVIITYNTEPQQNQPQGEYISFDVINLTRDAWGHTIEIPEIFGFPLGHKTTGVVENPIKHRNVPSVQEDNLDCIPGSFARSIKWLENEYDLENLCEDKTAQEIYDDLVGLGIGHGNPGHDEEVMLEAKAKYLKELDCRAVTKFVDLTGWMSNDVAGCEEENPENLKDWLQDELETEDVEMCYDHHCITITGIYTQGGKTYLEYRDDENQGDDNKGDTKEKEGELTKDDDGWKFDGSPVDYVVSESIEEDPCKKEPTLTDDSGCTTFHGVFVGVNDADCSDTDCHGAEDAADAMADNLENQEGWESENMTTLTGAAATAAAIWKAINDSKEKAKPGDEFVFFFANHGGQENDADGDEGAGDNKDETICASDREITDDELTKWISGFKDCVTITLKLSSCHSGGFDEVGEEATNSDGDPYGDDHINVDPACGEDETTAERPYKWTDRDNDGEIDGDELDGPLKVTADGRHVWDKNNNNVLDAGDEVVPPGQVRWMPDHTKGNLEALSAGGKAFDSYLKGDRNKDGRTTTKEAYEYTMQLLYEELSGDNDNDGLLNEDDYDFEQINGVSVRQYIDNDGDGWIDEDPGPPTGDAFWPNEEPNKPSKPSGETSGEVGVEYTYETEATDPEGDDVYYLFDWGDESDSNWVGPDSSKQTVSISHTWSEKGDYNVKVKARDRCFAESEWSDPLQVSMPKSKVININLLFLRFLENHPNLFPLIRQILGI